MSFHYKLFFFVLLLAILTVFFRYEQRTENEAIENSTAELFKAGVFQKSPNDRNDYQLLTLENGLEVLLISDPEADKAAAALNVNIGYFQDPEHIPGLAHFLEHMLFLGTETYPDSGEYQSFISQHGGSHNAYTTHQHTQYYFDIHPNYLQQALKRFARFFSEPLFNEELVIREVHAVDAEFKASYKDDDRRAYATLKALVNPKHPFSQFSTGNLKTLNAGQPHKLRQSVMELFYQYYHPKRMSLVILGKESLNTLKDWAQEFATPSQYPFQPIEPINEPLFTEDTLPLAVDIQSLDQRNVLNLLFPLPEAFGQQSSKALDYVEYLLNQQGQGSLEEALKARGWALNFSASQMLTFKSSAFFSIDIQLTDLGAKHQSDIVEQVYALIEKIKQQGLEDWRYQELNQQAQKAFLYKNQQHSLHLVSTLAQRLQDYQNPNQVISLPYIYAGFDKKRTLKLLDALNPNNSLTLWISPKAQGTDTEPYYQVSYDRSLAVAAPTNTPLWDEIQLQPPNPFISKTLNHHPTLNNEALSNNETLVSDSEPALLADSPLHHWHASDYSYKTPRANIFLDLTEDQRVTATAKTVVSHFMISQLVQQTLNQSLYQANAAGLYGTLNSHDLGVSIKIRGYWEKAPLLLEQMLKALAEAPLSNQLFKDLQHKITQQLQDVQKKRPFQQALAKLDQRLLPNHFPETELIAALNSLSLLDLQDYRQNWLKNLQGTLMTHGAITQQQALMIAERIQSAITLKKIPGPQPKLHLINQPEILEWSYDHSDKVSLHYVQSQHYTAPQLNPSTLEEGLHQRVAWALVGRMMKADFFEQLRTQEQLGYIVTARPKSFKQHPGIFFLVQSPKVSADKLTARVHTFIKNYAEGFNQITQETINKHQQGLANDLRKKPQSLSEKGNIYWSLLLDQQPFDVSERLAKATEALTREDIQQVLKEIASPNAHSLTIQTKLSKHQVPNTTTKYNHQTQ